MKARTLLTIVSLVALAACGQGGNTATTAANGAQNAAATVNCESPAQPLAIGASASGNIEAGQQYPGNARYYCINVPEGTSSLSITLSNLPTDLDLYVGSHGLASVQGVDISAGGHYEWKSNEFGTGDEHVVIDAPAAGIYYAEVVSYEGKAATFTLAAQ